MCFLGVGGLLTAFQTFQFSGRHCAGPAVKKGPGLLVTASHDACSGRIHLSPFTKDDRGQGSQWKPLFLEGTRPNIYCDSVACAADCRSATADRPIAGRPLPIADRPLPIADRPIAGRPLPIADRALGSGVGPVPASCVPVMPGLAEGLVGTRSPHHASL